MVKATGCLVAVSHGAPLPIHGERALWRGARRREREVDGVSEERLGQLGIFTSRAMTRGREVEGAAGARRPHIHSTEQVAGVIHPIMEAVLGLATGRTGPWALKQS